MFAIILPCWNIIILKDTNRFSNDVTNIILRNMLYFLVYCAVIGFTSIINTIFKGILIL